VEREKRKRLALRELVKKAREEAKEIITQKITELERRVERIERAIRRERRL